jgi:predicted RNase H-like HicB family nuclease
LDDTIIVKGEAHAAMVHQEGDLFVADCPDIGTASQGCTIAEAVANLKEATELHLEEFSDAR